MHYICYATASSNDFGPGIVTSSLEISCRYRNRMCTSLLAPLELHYEWLAINKSWAFTKIHFYILTNIIMLFYIFWYFSSKCDINISCIDCEPLINVLYRFKLILIDPKMRFIMQLYMQLICQFSAEHDDFTDLQT